MLTPAKIDSALKKLADGFLNSLRTIDSERAGWGQFVGPSSSNQVGLYGTSAGIICVALAYGPGRIPPSCVRWLEELWQARDTPGDGSRNFALTARRAFFLMALRICQHPDLATLISEGDKELLLRLVQDGLLVSWQIDAANRGATGNETVTGLAVLAYVLSSGPHLRTPPEIERAALALQNRYEGALPKNPGLRKFMLSSISLGVRPDDLSSSIKREVARIGTSPETTDQDALDWWDYYYSGVDGRLSKRDYLHAPSAAFDILLATGPSATIARRRAALNLAEKTAQTVLDVGLYFDGRELAQSKTQAWIAIALSRSKALIEENDNQPSRLKSLLSSILSAVGLRER